MVLNTGLFLFLVVLALPILAVVAPFFNLWYARNDEKVNQRLTGMKSQIEELKERRDAAYREAELAKAQEESAEAE